MNTPGNIECSFNSMITRLEYIAHHELNKQFAKSTLLTAIKWLKQASQGPRYPFPGEIVEPENPRTTEYRVWLSTSDMIGNIHHNLYGNYFISNRAHIVIIDDPLAEKVEEPKQETWRDRKPML